MINNIEEKVKDIIVTESYDELPVDNDNFYDLDFRTQLLFDSLQIVEVAMSCEAKFGITLSEDDVLNAKTPNDLIKLIKEKL